MSIRKSRRTKPASNPSRVVFWYENVRVGVQERYKPAFTWTKRKQGALLLAQSRRIFRPFRDQEAPPPMYVPPTRIHVGQKESNSCSEHSLLGIPPAWNNPCMESKPSSVSATWTEITDQALLPPSWTSESSVGRIKTARRPLATPAAERASETAKGVRAKVHEKLLRLNRTTVRRWGRGSRRRRRGARVRTWAGGWRQGGSVCENNKKILQMTPRRKGRGAMHYRCINNRYCCHFTFYCVCSTQPLPNNPVNSRDSRSLAGDIYKNTDAWWFRVPLKFRNPNFKSWKKKGTHSCVPITNQLFRQNERHHRYTHNTDLN